MVSLVHAIFSKYQEVACGKKVRVVSQGSNQVITDDFAGRHFVVTDDSAGSHRVVTDDSMGRH